MLTQIFSQQLSQPYPTQLLQVPSSKRWQQSRSLGWVCSRGGGRGLGGGNPAGRGGNGGMGGYKYCRPPKPEHSWTRPSRPRASARGRALAIAAQGRAITAVFRSVDICGARTYRRPVSEARHCRQRRCLGEEECVDSAFRMQTPRISYSPYPRDALAMCGRAASPLEPRHHKHSPASRVCPGARRPKGKPGRRQPRRRTPPRRTPHRPRSRMPTGR